MEDAGLKWNLSKCKCAHIKRGHLDVNGGNIMLEDGVTSIESLKLDDTYKYMGVPQSDQTASELLIESLKKKIQQRSFIIWSSDLSDFNKVVACNMFVNSSIEYYFWSQKFSINSLKEMDIIVRKSMNKCGAKHTNLLNPVLYLPRKKGGRGLRSIEQTYKEIKLKSAIKILEHGDKRMKLVEHFQKNCMIKGRASIFTSAKVYAEEMNLDLNIDKDTYSIKVKDGEELCGLKEVHNKMAFHRNNSNLSSIMSSTWQGLIINSRLEDDNQDILTGLPNGNHAQLM